MNNKHKQYGATTKDCWQPPRQTLAPCSVMDARLHRSSNVIVYMVYMVYIVHPDDARPPRATV
jgi:hypothetical protein